MLKQLIKRAPFFPLLRNFLFKKRQIKELRKWKDSEKLGIPPHIIKQKTLLKYAGRYNLKILVETGTYYGDMIEAMQNVFDKIYSIELNRELFEYTKKRFKHQKHIYLIHGDSGRELQNIMNKINKPALFWLDGHYSGGTTARGEKDSPIWEELNCILNTQGLNHVIIIDDANLFGTDSTYSTIGEVKKFVYSKRDNIQISVHENSVRIVPNV